MRARARERVAGQPAARPGEQQRRTAGRSQLRRRRGLRGRDAHAPRASGDEHDRSRRSRPPRRRCRRTRASAPAPGPVHVGFGSSVAKAGCGSPRKPIPQRGHEIDGDRFRHPQPRAQRLRTRRGRVGSSHTREVVLAARDVVGARARRRGRPTAGRSLHDTASAAPLSPARNHAASRARARAPPGSSRCPQGCRAPRPPRGSAGR